MNEPKSRLAIYPGTFDPITNGHFDIIQRAAPLFDRVIVALAVNSEKKPLFSSEERFAMLEECVRPIENVKVTFFTGLVVDYAEAVHADVIIRGLRAVSDFEYEFQMALTNRKLSHRVDTVFLMPDEKYTYLSSSTVKEIARHHGEIDCFVPLLVRDKLRAKFATKNL